MMVGMSIKENPFFQTLALRAYAFAKIPMVGFIRPKILELSENLCSIGIPLKRRNKNHLGSMYFGVLCAAADLAGGLAAMKKIQESKHTIHLIFKDFKADFHKRVEGDAVFINKQGKEIAELVNKAATSGEREEMILEIKAFVPSKLGQTAAASFKLTLSLKRRDSKVAQS